VKIARFIASNGIPREYDGGSAVGYLEVVRVFRSSSK
jgi:hypothetical protein